MSKPQDFRDLLNLLESVQVDEYARMNSKSRALDRAARGGREPELVNRLAPQELVDIYDNGDPTMVYLDPEPDERGRRGLPFSMVYDREKNITVLRPANTAKTMKEPNVQRIKEIFDAQGKRDGIDYEINVPSELVWVKGKYTG